MKILAFIWLVLATVPPGPVTGAPPGAAQRTDPDKCEIPGYPDNPELFDPDTAMLSDCRVPGIQLRSLALNAELGRCAIKLGMVPPHGLADAARTVEQSCDQVATMSRMRGANCFCPQSYYSLGND